MPKYVNKTQDVIAVSIRGTSRTVLLTPFSLYRGVDPDTFIIDADDSVLDGQFASQGGSLIPFPEPKTTAPAVPPAGLSKSESPEAVKPDPRRVEWRELLLAGGVPEELADDAVDVALWLSIDDKSTTKRPVEKLAKVVEYAGVITEVAGVDGSSLPDIDEDADDDEEPAATQPKGGKATAAPHAKGGKGARKSQS